MISAKVLAKQVEKFAVDNAPGILTGVGAVGAISAALLTGKATFRATKLIEEKKTELWQMTPDTASGNQPDYPELSTKDTIKLVWTEYLPPAGVLGVTLAAIICANRVSTARLAALATAYSLNEKHFGEYKEKVIEKFNANKERQVRDEIAQDRVTANPPKDAQIIITGNGDVLCHDLPTDRYFKSNMEKLRQVMNDINAQVNEVGYARLSEFYTALGLKDTPYSMELGWTRDRLFVLQFSAVLTDDNQPCISVDYSAEPIRNRFRDEGCLDDPGF
jgi:hypothetical protein